MAATTAATTEAPTAATSTRQCHSHASVLRVAPPIIGFAHVKRPLVAATSDPGCMQEGRWRRSNRPYLATCCEFNLSALREWY